MRGGAPAFVARFWFCVFGVLGFARVLCAGVCVCVVLGGWGVWGVGWVGVVFWGVGTLAGAGVVGVMLGAAETRGTKQQVLWLSIAMPAARR